MPLDYEGMAGVGRCWAPRRCRSSTTTCVVRAVRAGPSSTRTSPAASAPCAGGHHWLAQIYERARDGAARRPISTSCSRHRRCDLREVVLRPGDGAASPIISSLKWFRDEYEACRRRLPVRPVRLDAGGTGRGPRMTFPEQTQGPVPPQMGPLASACAAAMTLRRRAGTRHRSTWSPSPSTTKQGVGRKGTFGDSRGRVDRRRDPRFLRPPAGPRRRVPAVPGGGSRASASRWRRTTTVTPDMVVRTQHHQRGGRQGPARRDGTAADQPSAGLPGLRQGRRMPMQNQAMSNGRVETRFEDVTAHLPETDQPVVAGAAGPRAVCAVRARCTGSPTRWPATRSSNCWNAVRCNRSASLPARRSTPFSGNTVQICPVAR